MTRPRTSSAIRSAPSAGRQRLVRGVNDLEVYVMAEIPANAILVDEFAALFDGFSLNPDAVVRGLEAATPSWRASYGRSRRAGAAASWPTCGGPSTP